MQVQALTLGPLDTNTYLVIDEKANECLIIDPADAAQTIADEILAQKFNADSYDSNSWSLRSHYGCR